ncbi:hypothetical protein Hanom_Chr05g00453291 [Helianthus anomalus]
MLYISIYILQRLEVFHKTHTDKDENFSSSVVEEDYNWNHIGTVLRCKESMDQTKVLVRGDIHVIIRRLVLEYEALSQRSCEEGGSSSQPGDLAIFRECVGFEAWSYSHTRGIGPKPCSSTSWVVSGEESQTPQFSKFGSEDVDGEEVDDGIDDGMDMI